MTTADIATQHQQWIERQARFQQLEMEAERTVWSAERLKRYRSMGYSARRLSELSGHATLAVVDTVMAMRGKRK